MVLQVLNGKKNRHNVKSARLLAMFEGDKDSRHNVGIAFGPVLESVREAARDIGNLGIPCPTFFIPEEEPMDGE